MNWPNPTPKTAFLAGIWTGAVGVAHVLVGGLTAEQSGSSWWLFVVIGIIPVYPYVFGLKGIRAKMSRLPTAEDFADIFRAMKRIPFWMLGFLVPFLILWFTAVLMDIAN